VTASHIVPKENREVQAGLVTSVSLAPGKAIAAAVLVVALALLYRLYAMTGDIMYDPAVYAQDAYNLLHGTFKLDTDSWYSHRLPVFVPVVLAYATLGVSNISTNLWPLLLSVLQIMAVMWLGYRWLGKETAILAGFFMAIIPLDIIYAGILNPDVVIAAFLTFSVVCWVSGVEGRETPSRLLLLLSGLFCAVAVETRAYAFLIVLFFLGHAVWVRVSLKSLLWWVLGIAVVAVPTVIVYALVTGDLLLPLRAMTGFYGDPQRGEGSGLLYYPRVILALKSYTGLFVFLFTVASVWALVRPTRKRLILLAWIAPILLYLQFGSMSFNSYVPVFKRIRFLTPFIGPAALLSALVIIEDLRTITEKIARALRMKSGAVLKRVLLVGLVVVLLVNSFWIVRAYRNLHLGVARDFQAAASMVRSDGSIPVLIDHWRTAIRLAYYLDFKEGSHLYEDADETRRMKKGAIRESTRLGYLKWYENPVQLPDAFVVLEDGILAEAENVSVSDPARSKYPAKDIPSYCHNPPQSWELLGKFGTLRVFRTGPAADSD
jgi:4-amino-4-deoxy-L-arabinose transferase-like glycosyltransferase